MPEYNPFDWYWIVGGDESRLWSSAAGAWVDEMPDGAGVTRIASEAELDEVLAAYGLLGPTARRKVPKSVITARLIAAGKMEAAKQALDADAAAFGRWIASDRPAIHADDPDAVALLEAIGADPDEIMAPG